MAIAAHEYRIIRYSDQCDQLTDQFVLIAHVIKACLCIFKGLLAKGLLL